MTFQTWLFSFMLPLVANEFYNRKMKLHKSLRRSVSPFGDGPAQIENPWAPLQEAFQASWPIPEGKVPNKIKTIEDLAFVPAFLKKVFEAPANDAPELNDFCESLRRFQPQLEEKGLWQELMPWMKEMFVRKTSLFLMDPNHDVLFSKERDILLGSFFGPVLQDRQEEFAEFIKEWEDSEDMDRTLHFLDFLKGGKSPTLEHQMLLTHPVFVALLADKEHLKGIYDRTAQVRAKWEEEHPWETHTQQVLGV